jgi:hypothetical protein
MACGNFNIQVMHYQMQQFFVVYGYLKQTKDIETILANVKARANFMPEKTITMYRKLGKSRVEISALNH